MTNTLEFPRIASGTPLPEAVRLLAAVEIRTVLVALVDWFGSAQGAADPRRRHRHDRAQDAMNDRMPWNQSP